jgi:pimeloyl-ACP methyl ester carboxylesterase
MRRLHLVVERRAGRALARYAMGTRIGGGWDPEPAEPRAVAGAIAPTPLLVVHGDRDEFFPVDHGVELAEAGGPTAELWVEPGFGHAERAVTDDLAERIAEWVLVAVGSRRA